MRVIALSTLRGFWEKPAASDAREPILAWYRHAAKANWSSPADVKREFGTASVLRDGRVVFNIGGNKYRLVVWINYPYRLFMHGSRQLGREWRDGARDRSRSK